MLKDKIRQQYRVRLILDNLPITTYDLELDPESGGWRGSRLYSGCAPLPVAARLGALPAAAAPTASRASPRPPAPPPPAAAVRPGYEVGYQVDDKYYVNNHLMFKVLVHETHGQYTMSKQDEAEVEAAAAVEVRGRPGRGARACVVLGMGQAGCMAACSDAHPLRHTAARLLWQSATPPPLEFALSCLTPAPLAHPPFLPAAGWRPAPAGPQGQAG